MFNSISVYQKENNMLLSLCVITKNEEKNIKKCLESVNGILFEKIVVDTGSTDRTVELAKNSGAKVYDFKWIDDFSAARNYAISKAKGDWILFLDADEYIEPEQSLVLKNLVSIADNEKTECIISKLINYTPHPDRKIIQSVTNTIRVFKNLKNIRYVGAIHEVIQSNQNRPLYSLDASESLTVYHTGYSREEIERKDKSKRNLSLLFKELERRPNNSTTYVYIAESLMLNQKFEEAVPYLIQAKEFINNKNKTLLYKIYSNLLSCMCRPTYDLETLKKEYNDAVVFDRDCPDFDYYMGIKLYQLGKYDQAIDYIEISLSKFSSYDYNFESLALSRLNTLYDELRNLYIITEKNHKIVEVCVLLLKLEKYDYKSLYLLINTLKDFEVSINIYNFLFKIYNENTLKDKLYILRVAESLRVKELYNLVLALLTEEEKTNYIQFKEQKENSLEEYQLEAQNLTAVDCFLRGEFYNKKKNINKSLFFHNLSFEKNPQLAQEILPIDHANHNYNYHVEKEADIKKCPLCEKEAKVYSVYNAVTSIDFVNGFNPVRLWMYCEVCEHIFANNIPLEISNLLNNSSSVYERSPNLNLIHLNDEIINRIKQYTKGSNFMEIGIGSGEMLAVALEHGYNVTGIDIRKSLAKNVSDLLEIEINCVDFLDIDIKEEYDVICMGDVLEHLTNPVIAIEKLNGILVEQGIVWISTPNFNSAFSRIVKEDDPMWKVIEHINYFSYDSLSKLLKSKGFEILDYRTSRRYNGSMEVLARKVNKHVMGK
ncbi:glycosyltransferase [Peribacillus psychrosaccharolyticus]|nr:glycosyltransferase [Peribacillus psychrosaccharolyticus]MEC2055481.1 glycosyltransferase [Peribacillus psychrosaccharolyticus]MED3743491.1 glycosyltransferase [Peribacillus psychrosaccharolyticus]